jgi:hypothetical protein
MRTCEIEGCPNRHHSHGYCNRHRMMIRRHNDPTWQRQRTGCEAEGCHQTRTVGIYCSRHHKRLVLHIETPPPVPRSCRVWVKDCAWCGRTFAARMPHSTTCSRHCSRKQGRATRRAREAGARGTYTWTQVMRLHLLFDRRCAYCGTTIDGQPEPDHVVPLSRGGHNSIGNILPSCRSCNADKRDLLLPEWNADRTRRGLSARTTTWFHHDPRYLHLHADALSAAA